MSLRAYKQDDPLKFDEYLEDGRITAFNPDSRQWGIRLRDAIKKVRELGRPLDEHEMEEFCYRIQTEGESEKSDA